MLAFGLPLTLLVVLGWPALLLAVLSDAHFQTSRDASVQVRAETLLPTPGGDRLLHCLGGGGSCWPGHC